MKTDLTVKDITPELREAVAQYLEARVLAEMVREEVDAVQREILAETPLVNKTGRGPEIITDPAQAWRVVEDEQFDRYAAECNERLRSAGIKPPDISDDFCPALVTEEGQRQAEMAVIRETGKMLEWDDERNLNNALLCQRDGLEKRRDFIDAAVGAVLTSQ